LAAAALGAGYQVNDVLTIVGGTSTVAATISVTSVNGTGGITGISLLGTGDYTAAPANPTTVTGGYGTGAQVFTNLGIGNLVAALSGGLTLMVAYGLDSGDTMHVLQAVLDTQFWLSTHVVTVTLGYGATFLAGMLGTCSIVQMIWARPSGHSLAVTGTWKGSQSEPNFGFGA
jgi:hypothetical protein